MNAIRLDWDPVTCPAADYHLLFGSLGGVHELSLSGSVCAIGTAGTFDWLDLPAGDLFFFVVGVDGTGVYESSWGLDGSDSERGGTRPSGFCGVTSKVVTGVCLSRPR